MKRTVATPVSTKLTRLKDIGAGLCITAFPPTLVIGFGSHPQHP